MSERESEKTEELSFEDAIARIEQSVRRLEGNSLGLEQSLDEYAKATRYIAHCQKQLTSAKRRIEQLKGITRTGTAITEAWDAPEDEEPKPKKRKPS